MSEPIYIAQWGAPQTHEERASWVRACAAEAREKGCRHVRATVNPHDRNLILFEGWAEEIVKDEGEPRWHLVYGGN